MLNRQLHYSFDFDYTLADSSVEIIICFNYALKKMGLHKQSASNIQKTIGLSLQKSFEILSPYEMEKDFDRFIRLFKEKYDEVMLENINFYEDVSEVFSFLKSSGHTIVSIVSTKYKYRIEAALRRENLLHLVDNIIGGGCVNEVKPNPEGLIKAIDVSNIMVENTLYIGDSISDGECANLANVRFVAVSTGVTDKSLLEKWKPIKIISSLNGLVNVI
jgi:phosphoglycolate phosphatase